MENGSKKWPFSTRYLKRKFLQSHVLEIYLLLEERRSKGQTKMTHIQMSCLKLACYSFVRICLQVYVGFAGNLPVFQSWVDCYEGGEEVVKFPGSGSCWLLPCGRPNIPCGGSYN